MAAPPDHAPTWGLATVPAVLIFGFVPAILFQIVIDAIVGAGGGRIAQPGPTANFALAVTFDLSFVAAALLVVSRVGPLRSRDFGYRRTAAGRGAALVVLAAVVYFALTFAYGKLLHIRSERSPLPFTGGLALAFGCVIAPIAEEFFFRGFMFGALRRVGVLPASLIVGVLFGLVHLGSAGAAYIVPLSLFGFVLCLLRWRTASLYPCMALHAVNNAIAFGSEMSWTVGRVIAAAVVSLLVIAALTLPLAREDSPRAA